MENYYKIVDLFGNEETHFVAKKESTKTLFSDYEKFVDKFQPKKTTDDCYTPDDIYKEVLDFVKRKCDLGGLDIVRPFYPGGDYQSIQYPKECAVIDNPPFSILAEIVGFYMKENIKFFLFAPHLTLFSNNKDITYIPTYADICYDNGAKVKTSFVSNMLGDIRVMTAPSLHQRIKEIQEKRIYRKKLPTYQYPANVLTVSMTDNLNRKGIELILRENQCFSVSFLDSQKKHGKAIFGRGFLISDKAAADKAAADKLAAEKVEHKPILKWELSSRELEIICSLDNEGKQFKEILEKNKK